MDVRSDMVFVRSAVLFLSWCLFTARRVDLRQRQDGTRYAFVEFGDCQHVQEIMSSGPFTLDDQTVSADSCFVFSSLVLGIVSIVLRCISKYDLGWYWCFVLFCCCLSALVLSLSSCLVLSCLGCSCLFIRVLFVREPRNEFIRVLFVREPRNEKGSHY